MDLFCNSCGREIVSDGKFCPYCGKEVDDINFGKIVSSDIFDEDVVRTDKPIQDTEFDESYLSVNTDNVDMEIPEKIPEEHIAVKTENKSRKKLLIFVAFLVLIVLGGLFLTLNQFTIEINQKEEQPPKKPETTIEIVDFYKNALKQVYVKGNVGYDKKEWQELTDASITKLAIVDEIISHIFDQNFVSEKRAVKNQYFANTEDAKTQIPPFELTDLSCIESAVLTEQNGNYYIEIIFFPCEDPEENNTYLQYVTNGIYYKSTVVEPMLNSIPQLNNFENVKVIYNKFKITCEITPFQKLLYLKHSSDISIVIGKGNIYLIPFNNLLLKLNNTAEYNYFTYSEE